MGAAGKLRRWIAEERKDRVEGEETQRWKRAEKAAMEKKWKRKEERERESQRQR